MCKLECVGCGEIHQGPIFPKVFVGFFFAVFLTLAALTASLPLNMPSKQGEYSGPELALIAALDTGNTAYIMVCTALGLLLSPALLAFHGSVNGKDLANIFGKFVITMAGVVLLWIVITFSIVYGKDSQNQGILAYPATYYMFKDVGIVPDPLLCPTIPLIVFAMFEVVFPIASLAIILAYIGDIVNVGGWLFFAMSWHCLVWSPVAHVVWSPLGALYTNYIMDFSGGIVVHICGAIGCLAFMAISRAVPQREKKPVNNTTVIISTALYSFAWLGFNSGKAHIVASTVNGIVNASIAGQSIANSVAAVAASVITWWAYDFFVDKPFTPVAASNAIMLGLIAITPASGFTAIGGAMIIAILSTTFVYWGAFLTNERVDADDSLKVWTLHGMGGLCGFFLTAIFSYQYINPAGYNGLTFGRGIPLSYHIAAMLVFFPCIFIATYLVMGVCHLICPIYESQSLIPGEEDSKGFELTPAEPGV